MRSRRPLLCSNAHTHTMLDDINPSQSVYDKYCLRHNWIFRSYKINVNNYLKIFCPILNYIFFNQ